MRRKEPVPNRAVHEVTPSRRTATGIAIGIVSMTCLLPMSAGANADVGRPSQHARIVVAQPDPDPPADTDQAGVSFRVLTDGANVPPPLPPHSPPRTLASTGMNLPVAELIGLALALLALGLVVVAITVTKHGATPQEQGDV